MKKIIVLLTSILLIQSCISMYENAEGGSRPKHPKFKLKKKITLNNTGLNGIFKENSGYDDFNGWFHFFENGRVYFSRNQFYNKLNNGYIGYYIKKNNEITIELLYNTQGYFYTTIKGQIINNSINFNEFSTKSISDQFDDTYIKIDTILEPIEPDW